MAVVRLNSDDEDVVGLVLEYCIDKYGEGTGRLERIDVEARMARQILARLVDVMAEKELLSHDEIVKVIRGW